MAGFIPALIAKPSIHSVAVGFFIRMTVMRLRWCGISKSPTPSVPKLVVANTIEPSGNFLVPKVRSNITRIMPFLTDGFALPNSSIIKMIGLSWCRPISSLGTKRTKSSVLSSRKILGNIKSPKSLVVQSK